MQIRTLKYGAAIAAILSTLAASAQASATQVKDVSIPQGPPVSELVTPYQPLLECLNHALSAEQKSVVFSVDSFPDRTNRINYISDSGIGSFASQGADVMMMTALKETGIKVMNFASVPKSEYIMQKEMAVNDAIAAQNKLLPADRQIKAPFSLSLMLPDVLIGGAINTLDIVPGTSVSGSVQGVGAGGSASRILITMDVNATRTTGTPADNAVIPGQGGEVLYAAPIQKQLTNYEVEAKANTVVGPISKLLGINFDLDHQKREALQYAGRVMVDYAAYKAVSGVFHVTACGPQEKYIEASLQSGFVPLPYSQQLAEQQVAKLVSGEAEPKK